MPNFPQPRPLNLRENYKQNEAKLIHYYFLERKHSASFISGMPGKKCVTPGCSISRKNNGITIFEASLVNNELKKKWSQDLTHISLKYQQRDKSLNERIESHKLFICE